MHRRGLVFATFIALVSISVARAEDAPKPVLKKGARVAVVGDSITEQKLYSKYIELYLTACMPQLELKLVQLGWGGETAPGFQNRMNNDLLPYKPDVVTTCYGMNDGGYGPYNENTGKRYGTAMAEIVKRVKDAGGIVVVGSPGIVDSKYFRGGGEAAKIYNATLGQLRDIAKKLAADNNFNFANVFDAMMAAMEKAKKGVRHHQMAVWAWMHAILAADIFGDDKKSDGTRSILPYVPFNQDLNRLTLIVKNLDGDKAKVTWGAESKVFSKADLEKGINLADQFIPNPFADAFRKLDGLIGAKENFETGMIKGTINQFPGIGNAMGEEVKTTLDELRAKMWDAHQKMHNAVRAAVVPVKYTLTVAVEK